MNKRVIGYDELEAAYEAASASSEPEPSEWDTGAPSFAVLTIRSAAIIHSKVTGDPLVESRLWLLNNAELELVDVEGIGWVYRLITPTGTLLMYPD
jgi:hypothetical protein